MSDVWEQLHFIFDAELVVFNEKLAGTKYLDRNLTTIERCLVMQKTLV